MTRRFVATVALGLLLAIGVAFGALTHHPAGPAVPAAGQTDAAIEQKPLVLALTDGDSFAAERNLYPAPETALQLADPLALTPAQRQDLRSLQQKTDSELNALSARIAVEERRLDFAFAQSNVSPGRIDSVTAQLGTLQGHLRAVRLRSHLAAHEILTPEQLLRYAKLRGYQPAPPDLYDDLDPGHAEDSRSDG
jgi:hypothetical protein